MKYEEFGAIVKRALTGYYQTEQILINDEPLFYITGYQLADLQDTFDYYRKEVGYGKELKTDVIKWLKSANHLHVSIETVINRVIELIKNAKIESGIH